MNLKYYCLIVISLIIFTGAGCGSTNSLSSSTTTTNASTGVVTARSKTKIVPEAGVTVHYPGDYDLVENSKTKTSGAFLSYNFEPLANQTSPRLSMIEFFSDDSLNNTSNTSLLAEYTADKTSLATPTSDNKQHLTFNDQPFIVTTTPCSTGGCMERRYRTFFQDTMVDIVIAIDTSAQVTAADTLFQTIKLIYLY